MLKLKFLKIFFVLTIVAAFMLPIVSCDKLGDVNEASSTSIQQSSENNGDETEEIASSQNQKVSIWISSEPQERIFLMESINNFMSDNPGIEVTARHFRNEEELSDTYTAASLAGSGPEMVLAGFDTMRKLASDNVVKDLSNEFEYDKFLPGLVELSNYENKKYSVPFSSKDFLVFYYNKSLVDEKFLNFESVLEFSKSFTDAPSDKYGFLLNVNEPDWIIPFVGGYLDWVYDYEGMSIFLNSNGMEKTLDFINNIYNIENILPPNKGYEEINNSFKSGNTAAIINGVWAIQEYEEAGINFGVAKIPKLTGASTNPTPMISGSGFMVNVNCSSKCLESSKKFISFMVSNDEQVNWTLNTQSFPAVNNLENEKLLNNEAIYNILLQAKICRGVLPQDDLRIARDAIRINVESLLSDNILPSEAKDKMQEDAIKLKSGTFKIEENEEESAAPETEEN